MSRSSNNNTFGLVLLIGTIAGFFWSLFKYPIPTIIGASLIIVAFFPNSFWTVLCISVVIGVIYYLVKQSDKPIVKIDQNKMPVQAVNKIINPIVQSPVVISSSVLTVPSVSIKSTQAKVEPQQDKIADIIKEKADSDAKKLMEEVSIKAKHSLEKHKDIIDSYLQPQSFKGETSHIFSDRDKTIIDFCFTKIVQLDGFDLRRIPDAYLPVKEKITSILLTKYKELEKKEKEANERLKIESDKRQKEAVERKMVEDEQNKIKQEKIMKETKEKFGLNNFIGQEKIVNDLKKRIEFCESHKQPLPHVMLSGVDDMGKKTLAQSIAAELESDMKIFPGNSILKVGDLASILTNLSAGDILVVDDVGKIKKTFKEVFWNAVETSTLDVIVGKGPSARQIQLDLPKFSVVVTTSKLWQIDEKIRRWFVVYDFSTYSLENIRDIIIKLAVTEGFHIDKSAATIFAGLCNGTPGNAAAMVRRMFPYIKTISIDLKVNAQIVPQILSHLGYGDTYPASLTTADNLTHMTGLQFEHWVADHFRKQGYKVEFTKATGDHGIDLLLYKSNVLSAVVQCKRWEGFVGEPVVRDFYGSMMSHKAPEGFIFASTSFTQSAKDFANGKQIKLVDLEMLLKLAEIT